MARATRSSGLVGAVSGGFFPTVFVFGEDRWVESHHQGGALAYSILWTCRGRLPTAAVAPGPGAETARALPGPGATPGHWLATSTAGRGLPAYIDKDGNPVTSVDRGGLVEDLDGRGGDPYVLEMMTLAMGEARFVESAEDAHLALFLATLASLLPR